MSFNDITLCYLEKLQSAYQSATITQDFTPELSYKPILDSYFRNIIDLLAPDAEAIFEPSIQEKSGRPDWRFYDKKSLGTYGYIEGKGLRIDASIPLKEYSVQIKKYLQLKNHLILTDGVEFHFFNKDSKTSKIISLLDKGECKEWPKYNLCAIGDLEIALKEFFLTPGSRKCSERELIREAARRARALADIAITLVDIPLDSGCSKEENDAIKALAELKELLYKHHDPALRTPALFADFIAQVLVFGLLYAQRFATNVEDTPQERLKKMNEFWTNSSKRNATSLLPFHELIVNLNLSPNSDSNNPLHAWYDDCSRCLAHSHLNNEHQIDFHILYEDFLEAYDSKSKKDFGVFYTNPTLANMMVLAVDVLARQEFKIESIFSDGINVIDPCCGTGTFIEKIAKNTPKNINLNISGFEIQPAPYALANYRMELLKEEMDFSHDIRIILTNTLSDRLEEKIFSPCDLFEQEQQLAHKLVQAPLILVIGNPPSSDSLKEHSSRHTSTQKGFSLIQSLLEDFRPPEEKRGSRQNIQQHIQDDFMKFLRWGCEKVLLNDNAILAYIIPSSFFESSSYRYARLWLAKKFQKIWVLKFDEDTRKGINANNLFKVRQGRSVIFALRGKALNKTSQCTFFYKDISQCSLEEKMEYCNTPISNFLANFKEITLSESGELLVFSKNKSSINYNKGILLYSDKGNSEKSIFQRHCSGLKLAPTSLFTHLKKQQFIRKCKEIGNKIYTVKQILDTWFSGQIKKVNEEKLSDDVRQGFTNAAKDIDSKIKKYSFRPFLENYVFIDNDIFSTIISKGGSGTRVRPELQSAFEVENNIGFAVAPAPKDIGAEIHRFVSFCWHIPDNDLCSRQNAHVFCAQYPDYKTAGQKQSWNETPQCNIDDSLLSLGLSKERWVFYTYAIMASNWYLSHFDSYLYSDSESIPRVPIHKNKGVLEEIATLGEEIALCEKEDTLSIEENKMLEEESSCFTTSFPLKKIKISSEEVVFFDMNQTQKFIYKRDISKLESIKIAGYKIINTWIKFYTYPYSRCEFTNKDFKAFLSLLYRLEKQDKLIYQLDIFLEEEFSNDFLWE